MHSMLLFIYSGKVQGLNEKAEKLLTASEKYDLKTLKQMCEELLCEKMDRDNVLELLLLSDLNRAPTLRAQAVKYILAHGKQVVSQSGWREKLKIDVSGNYLRSLRGNHRQAVSQVLIFSHVSMTESM